MAEQIRQVQPLVKAAGTAGRLYFGPTTQFSSEVWKVKKISFFPNNGITADGTNYATLQAFKGASTAVTAARATSSTGFTQGTAENQAVTATGADAEISSSSPLSVRVSHAGSGAAVDMSVAVDFEVVRQ